ncbi:MAG: hypothetical protein R2849_07355 [Thermomicrobiales bacterium]
MRAEMLLLMALSGPIVTGVAVVAIAMALAVCILGLRRRESGYDPMLIVSAAAVVVLAVAILATR